MKTVLRFALEHKPVQVIKAPKGVKFDHSRGRALYAVFDNDAPLVDHTIAITTLGFELPPAKTYEVISTYENYSTHYVVLLLTQPSPAGLAAFEAAVAAAKSKAKKAINIPAPVDAGEDEDEEEEAEEDDES